MTKVGFGFLRKLKTNKGGFLCFSRIAFINFQHHSGVYLKVVFTSAIEIQAAAVAQTASKSISELQNAADDSESSKDEEGDEGPPTGKESEDENDKLRKSALDKLEKASEDSMLSQARHKWTLCSYL